MSRGSGSVLVLAGAVAGLAVGCLVELDHRIACGDGYVDPEAGEECDPMDPDSLVGPCSEAGMGDGLAKCNATSCTLEIDRTICAKCNDGVLSPTEECDLTTDDECPNGGRARCTDCHVDLGACSPWCGDGEIGPDEECDPGEGGFAIMQSCTERQEGLALIPSPYGEGHLYGSGQSTCSECRWSRVNCSYCGNGQRDDELQVDLLNPTLMAPAEWCDGELMSDAALDAYASQHGITCAPVTQRPNVSCVPIGMPGACYGFVAHDDGQPCCQKATELYPGDDADLRCCFEYEHPGEQPWHLGGLNQLCN